jgi:hypothetical protein
MFLLLSSTGEVEAASRISTSPANFSSAGCRRLPDLGRGLGVADLVQQQLGEITDERGGAPHMASISTYTDGNATQIPGKRPRKSPSRVGHVARRCRSARVG